VIGGARRRRLLAGGAVLVVLLLVGGRWAAVETAERGWAATVPGGEVYLEARDLARLVHGVILMAGALWGVVQLYLVYRAIGSVQVPRRVGNIEIVEAVPQRLLLGLALGVGLAYGTLLTLNTGDWWLLASLAADPPVFGTSDPVLGRDLGYFVSTLPWVSALQDRAVLAALSAVVLVGLLYFGMGALRFDGVRPIAGAHTRSHLGTLLATLAIAFAWGALLDPAQVVSGASGRLDHTGLSIRIPAATAVVAAALVVAGVSLSWAWTGRPALIAVSWAALGFVQFGAYVLAPEVVRAGRGRAPGGPAAAASDASLEPITFLSLSRNVTALRTSLGRTG